MTEGQEQALKIINRLETNLTMRFKFLRMAALLGPIPQETEQLVDTVERDVQRIFGILRIALVPVPVEKSAEERARP